MSYDSAGPLLTGQFSSFYSNGPRRGLTPQPEDRPATPSCRTRSPRRPTPYNQGWFRPQLSPKAKQPMPRKGRVENYKRERRERVETLFRKSRLRSPSLLKKKMKSTVIKCDKMEESDSSMTSVDPSSRSDPSLTQCKAVMAETEQGQSSDITTSDSDTIATDLNNTLTSLTPDPDLSNTDVDYSAGVKGSEDQSCTSCLSSSCFTDESTDESSPQKRSKKVPEFSSQNWHMNKCFDRYWKHYYHSMAWCQRHFHVMKYMSGYVNYPHTFYQMNFPKPMTPPNVRRGQQFKMGHGEGRGRGHGRSRGGLRRGTGQYKNVANRNKKHGPSNQTQETESDLGVESDDSEVYEMEVTKEMVQFFAHSHEHRKKRDASKEIIGEDGTVQKRVQIEEVKANKKPPTVEAPSERPGVRRTAEMIKLYGKGAAMIHGMETAIQMSYDRTMDIQQPKFWPNMPLKIVFS